MAGVQVIGETVHYFLQVVDKYSCKKTRIFQGDQQTEDGCFFTNEEPERARTLRFLRVNY